MEVIKEEEIKIITLSVVPAFKIMMSQLILDKSLTGDPCQRRITRKLYPNDVGLESRRYKAVDVSVAASVAVLIPQIPKGKIKITSVLSRRSRSEQILMINIVMVQEKTTMQAINLVDSTVRK